MGWKRRVIDLGGFPAKATPQKGRRENHFWTVLSVLGRTRLFQDSRWIYVDGALTNPCLEPFLLAEARFTALRFQDPQFLASTEKSESAIRERANQWSVTMGLEEMDPWLGWRFGKQKVM